MEQPNTEIPTFPQPENIQPAPVTLPPLQKSKLPMIFIMILLLVLFTGVGIVLGKYVLNPTTSSVEKLVLPTPTVPSVLATPTPDPTTNWKTYTSLNGKYQFQYPNDVTVFEEKQLITDVFENYTYIKKDDQTLATIVFFASSYTRYATLDDFAKGERLQRDDLLNQVKEIISIANTTAYKFKLNPYGDPGPNVIVKLNNQFVNFINHGFQNFDQILSTFKFLD